MDIDLATFTFKGHHRYPTVHVYITPAKLYNVRYSIQQ